MKSNEEDSISARAALLVSARRSLSRFPGVLLIATLGTALVVQLGFTQPDIGGMKEPAHWRLILTCILGISWLYSLSLIAERRFRKPWNTWLPLLVGCATLGLYYFRLTRISFEAPPVSFFFECGGLFLALHFFAAYAPFLGRQEPRGFWEYNKAIFLRFLLALLFSLTLLLGSNLFFAALAQVLRFAAFGKILLVLTGGILGVFNTWFFLAGVPQDFEALESSPRPYPRVLKFFASFVLVPLAIAIGLVMELWLLVGLATFKTLDSEKAAIFLFFGAFGLLTYLLLYPLRQDAKQRWLKIFEKGFFTALLPMLTTIGYTAILRIQRFGWTAPRYFAILLSAWGLGLCLYLIFSKKQRIQWIPVSLSLLALLGTTGPLSAFSTTRRSQEARLQSLLRNAGLKDGDVTIEKLSALPQSDREGLLRQVDYLESFVDCESLRPYFGKLIYGDGADEKNCRSQRLRGLLNRDPSLPPAAAFEPEPIWVNFLLASSMDREVAVRGFDDYFPSSTVRVLEPGRPADECPKPYDESPLCATQSKANFEIDLYLRGQPIGKLNLEPVIQGLMQKHFPDKPGDKKVPEETEKNISLSREELSFDLANDKGRFRLGFEQIRMQMRAKKLYPDYLRFSLLFKPGT
ncbi:MAG: DUF4153 domain-containing protein [Deltaproteobacteria bacterium]|nr:DUF4153 domain-containing protein [Deltaproteobacteria bacterium]